MNFSFDYSYFDGPAQLHSSLAVRGASATLIRQAGSPIGVFHGTLSDQTIDALWKNFPASVPPGPPLMPGMPNHWFVMKREGAEKSIRLAATPNVLTHAAPFMSAVQAALKDAAASQVRTLSVRWAGWNAAGAEIELTAAGTQELVIPDAAAAIHILAAPESSRQSLDRAAYGPAGELRLAPGSKRIISIPFVRRNGMVYQAIFRSPGVTTAAAKDLHGETGSGMAPQ